jgi:hypothetical protein
MELFNKVLGEHKKMSVLMSEGLQSRISIKNKSMEILEVFDKIDVGFKHIHIKNKGTGAGGANTNKNGLRYEDITHIPTLLNIESTKKIFGTGNNDHYYVYEQYVILKQSGLHKYLQHDYVKCEKKTNPDECIIDADNRVLYIIEKKFQQCNGSVDEKIQTGHYKKWFYKKQYPTYTIVYIYVLSDWFKQKKYRPEMEYLHNINIHVLFGSDPNYITNLLNLLS